MYDATLFVLLLIDVAVVGFLICWSGIVLLVVINLIDRRLRPRATDVVRITYAFLIVEREEYMFLLLPKVRRREYMLCDIRNIRYGQPAGIDRGRSLIFDYQGDSVAIGENLQPEQTRWLVETLQTVLTFRCHEVQQVVFGAALPPVMWPNMGLLNPDVSYLQIPFWGLTQIVVMTATYDFHLLERFVTYAVNALGQTYLKTSVDVEIRGDPAELHPNLRNSLTNLCRNVTVKDRSS